MGLLIPHTEATLERKREREREREPLLSCLSRLLRLFQTRALFLFLSVVFSGNCTIMVFWIFGYGSLVWNPGFDYDEKIIGFIKDYRRVFDLACIDHRGSPEHPARTCTLEEKEGAICWGAAYCVRGGAEKERLAMEYLEKRECEYDRKTLVNFFKEEDPSEPALTGVIVLTSTPEKSNKYYLGPAPLEEMASQIATAVGPCGNNRDYLFKLEKAMFDIGHEDDMVIELANEVRRVLEIMEELSKEKTLVTQSHISSLHLHPLPEAISIAMDS